MLSGKSVPTTKLYRSYPYSKGILELKALLNEYTKDLRTYVGREASKKQVKEKKLLILYFSKQRPSIITNFQQHAMTVVAQYYDCLQFGISRPLHYFR